MKFKKLNFHAIRSEHFRTRVFTIKLLTRSLLITSLVQWWAVNLANSIDQINLNRWEITRDTFKMILRSKIVLIFSIVALILTSHLIWFWRMMWNYLELWSLKPVIGIIWRKFHRIESGNLIIKKLKYLMNKMSKSKWRNNRKMR